MQRKGGFTILELLIAAAITSGIVVILGLMFGGLAGSASRATQRIDAFRDARAAMQMMIRDLSALVHTPSSAYFLVTDQTYQDPAATRAAQVFAICAVKNQPSTTSGSAGPSLGDLSAVGYYCRWDTDQSGGQGHYALHRYFRDSATTFGFFKNAGPGTYVSPVTLYSPAATDDVLASCAWNLKIVTYKTDATVDTTFPMEVGQPGVTLPAAIELSFTAMSSNAAKTAMAISSTPADWTDATSATYQRVIGPHAYLFRTRINLL